MEWFVGLPLAAQISLGIAFLIVLLCLAYLGKVNIKMGKNIISFGRTAKRSCGDCILLILGKRERMESQRNFILNRILKEQMNYAEQKILDVQNLLLTNYREMLCKHRKEANSLEENKQYRLYQGLLGNALVSVKDELRRSFKENGFEHLGGIEFSAFVKNKFATLLSLAKDHINNMYPYEGMIVTAEDRVKNLEKQESKLEDWCFELFTKAKDISLDSKKKVESLTKEFSKEIDEFLQERH